MECVHLILKRVGNFLSLFRRISHASTYTVPVYVYYNDVAISYGIENNLREQQCIISLCLARTQMQHNFKNYVCMYVYKPWDMHMPYKFFDSSLTDYGQLYVTT